MDDLKGKVALVTGASTGIGAAVAREFGRLGMKVAVHYFASGEAAEQVAADVRAAGGEAITPRADAHSSAAMRQVVADTVVRLGRLDILVNNAGGLLRRMPIEQFDDAISDDVIDLNVLSGRSPNRPCTGNVHFLADGAIEFHWAQGDLDTG